MFFRRVCLYAFAACCFDIGFCINDIILQNGVSPNKVYESKWNDESVQQAWYPSAWLNDDVSKTLGQVSGVAVGPDNKVYIFHRADRVWNMNTFDRDNMYMQRNLGPISRPTILVIHNNGTLLKSWGSGLFYLPHGITVDKQNNVWVTDVALHQVMKFTPSSNSPQLILGKKFTPGRDSGHFCKPTSVAVAPNGDFFVADGYCNYRILKYNASGVKILEWGRSTVLPIWNVTLRQPGMGEFYVPHALTIAEDRDLICVADRENGRVQCFNVKDGSFVMSISSPTLGSRIFSVTYSPAKGGMFFIVNGPALNGNLEQVCGHVVSASGKHQIMAQFGLALKNPHDLAVSSDGNFIYVGEIDPYVVWKFVHNFSVDDGDISSFSNGIFSASSHNEIHSLAGAILVIGTCLVFAAAVIIGAFIYSHSKKSGSGQCSDNRWLFNSGTAEGFILEKTLGHQGFEKHYIGEESDEEQQLA